MVASAAASSCCWSDLHNDLLHEIAHHLDVGDLPRFSAVCSSWSAFYLKDRRSYRCLSKKSQIPWLQLPCTTLSSSSSSPLSKITNYESDMVPRFYSVTEDKIYEIHLPHLKGHRTIGSSDNGFLISADNTAADLHAINPLTGAHILLPPTSTLPYIAGTNRHPSSGQITSYTMRGDDHSHMMSRTLDLTYMRNCYFSKVVLITHIGGGATATATAVVSCAKFNRETPACLAFARSGDAAWTLLHSNHHYVDIIYHKGRLHGITSFGVHAIFDLDRPSEPPIFVRQQQISETRLNGECCLGWHLVESADGDDLFAVARKYIWTGTVGFAVFKFISNISDQSHRQHNYQWSEEVRNLGKDAAMFMSPTGSSWMIATTTSLPPPAKAASGNTRMKANCIYFPEDFDGDGGIGVFNLGDGSINQLSLATHLRKHPRPLPLWFKPSLF